MTDLEFQDLLDRSLEGPLSDEESRRLWNDLLADESRRTRFLRERELHDDLRQLLSPGAGEGAFLQGVLAELSASRKDPASFARDVVARVRRNGRRGRRASEGRRAPLFWLIAAAALVAVSLLAALTPSPSRRPVTVQAAPVVREVPPSPPAAPPQRPASAPRSEAKAPAEAATPKPTPEPAKAGEPAGELRRGRPPEAVSPEPPEPPKPPPAPPPPAPTRAAIAHAERVRGESYLVFEDRQTPIQEGDPIFAGQGVHTVGEAALVGLRFEDGTRLHLGGDTTVRELTESDAKVGKSFTLSVGTIWADVPKQPAGRPLVVQTPHGRAQVVGTQFFLAVTAEASALEVEEGRVRLIRSDGAFADVGKDQYAVASKGPVPSAKPLVNLLTDPGFEKLGQGWSLLRPQGGLLAGRRTVPGGVRGAGRVLEVAADPMYEHQVFQDVPVVPGASYGIRAWMKSKDVRGGRLELLWLGAAGLSDVPAPSALLRIDLVERATGSTDWKRIFGRYRAPAGSKVVRVRWVTDAGPGTLWADELRFNRTAP